MPMAIGSKVQARFIGHCFGQQIMLTTAYEKTVGAGAVPTATELSAMLADLLPGGGVDMKTPYLAALPPEYTLTGVQVQQVWPVRSAYVNSVQSAPGTHASSATVANDSAALTFRGEFAGRENVGTKHIGPVPDAVSAAGMIVAGYVTILNTLASAMKSDVIGEPGSTWRPIILGKPPEWHSVLIETHLVGRTSRVQRRRTVGVGR